ncbi:MAG: PspC domain-containing protein [Bacteroidia bacterium]|nr:PspC domain-containing protein [Bacteroidia bacterium]
MKKTVNINISGIVFHIDEDAYEMLQTYLHSLSQRYSGSESGNEIISDIESRIAELFREKTTGSKEVITIDDTREVISILGSPEEFDTGDNNHSAGQEQSQEYYGDKRLYRDPDNRVFGGVCGGLGHYFNIDPVILRVLFVILFFAFGTSFLIYLVLWIAIPSARSTAQKLEMRGKRINVSNIEQSIKDEFHEVKNSFKNFRKSDSYKKGYDFFYKLLKMVGLVIAALAKILIGLFGAIFIIIGIVLLAGILGPVVFGFNFYPFEHSPFTFFIASTHATAALLTGLVLLIGVPVLAMIFGGIKMIFRFKSNNRVIWITAGIFFLFGLFLTVGAGFIEMQNYRENGRITEMKDLNMNKQHVLYLSVAPDTLAPRTGHNEKILQFKGVNLMNVDGKLRFLCQPSFEIVKSDNDRFQVEMMREAKGRSRKIAGENATNIDYYWSLKDSTLILNPYFTLKENNGWRGQKMLITLKMPVGATILIGKDMDGIIYDIDNVSHTADYDMLGKKWTMKQEGLTLAE